MSREVMDHPICIFPLMETFRAYLMTTLDDSRTASTFEIHRATSSNGV